MPTEPHEKSLIEQLARELARCRRRGLDHLDDRRHNQEPVELPELERLARDYCQASGLALHGRRPQIRRLLQDALRVYGEQDSQGDSAVMTRLFFEPSGTRRPGDVFADFKEQSDWTEEQFDDRWLQMRLRFANFLVAFVDDAAQAAAPRTAAPEPAAPAPSRIPYRVPLAWIGAGVAALLILGGVLTAVVLTHNNGAQSNHPGAASSPAVSPHPSSPPYVAGQTYAEQEGHVGMRNTYPDPYQASAGPGIDPLQQVEVSCKKYAPSIGTASPDGYWYRLASPPYNDRYWAIANTFLNGNPVEGTSKVPQINTDWKVPDCPSP